MARLRGRALNGERLRAGIPYGHWKTTTFVAGLRLTGMMATMVLDEPGTYAYFCERHPPMTGVIVVEG